MVPGPHPSLAAPEKPSSDRGTWAEVLFHSRSLCKATGARGPSSCARARRPSDREVPAAARPMRTGSNQALLQHKQNRAHCVSPEPPPSPLPSASSCHGEVSPCCRPAPLAPRRPQLDLAGGKDGSHGPHKPFMGAMDALGLRCKMVQPPRLP